MFGGARNFNSDISGWNTQSATSMNNMFTETSFNQNISDWNVSNVTDMSGMFNTSQFNQDISGWDVSNVGDMNYMFYGNRYFNQDINIWDVQNVANMNGMFYYSIFNQPLSGWNVSNVIDMGGMFRNSRFNQDIKGDMVLIGNNILGPSNNPFNDNGGFNHLEDMQYIDIDQSHLMPLLYFNLSTRPPRYLMCLSPLEPAICG